MDKLELARNEIDIVDKEMAQLFCKRMDAVKLVVEHKIQNNIPVLDSSREEAVVKKNVANLNNVEYAEFYEKFIRHNMELSRALQHKILSADKVAYQGAKGAFAHIAAKRLFAHGQLIAYSTWASVVQAVKNGEVHCGVLPFENSQAGDVSDVLDLCYCTPEIYVSDVFDLPVSQNLLGVKGAKLSDIKTVMSHPQALAQSAKIIKTLKLNEESCLNTAIAAKFVADKGDVTIAAIASQNTAELYGLDILAENINESADNTTRFIVIQKGSPSMQNIAKALDNDMTFENEQDKRFSLLFTVVHESGSLSKVIQTVAKLGYNMECIKSRPIPQAKWEYYFYTELVGNPSQQLMKELKPNCRTVRLLGLYNRKN